MCQSSKIGTYVWLSFWLSCEKNSCQLTTSYCDLQDSEGRELELAAKTAGKHAEQAELAGRVADCQAKLEAKLQDLRAVANAKQQVWTNILTVTSYGHRTSGLLWLL